MVTKKKKHTHTLKNQSKSNHQWCIYHEKSYLHHHIESHPSAKHQRHRLIWIILEHQIATWVPAHWACVLFMKPSNKALDMEHVLATPKNLTPTAVFEIHQANGTLR